MKLRHIAELYFNSCLCQLKKGDEVVADGLQGYGVIIARDGRRVTIRYTNGEYVTRDQKFVHPVFKENVYKSRYKSPMERRP